MRAGPVESIVIVGGGTAGWIAAAALAKLMGDTVSIRLVESDAIGTVGVGEATIPQIRRLNQILGIDEREFLSRTHGTVKLGIEFNGWGAEGESYLHTFGDAGIDFHGVRFHHYWKRWQASHPGSSYWDYSLHHRAAYAHKFAHLERVGNTSMTGLAYAYHFDAGAYALFLRDYAERQGVVRTEGRVVDVGQNAENGFVEAITLESGETLAGDLFIDCTGFRGLLMEAVGSTYLDWSHWLPVDRAVAVGCEATTPLLPYTKATARDVGWQWRIPLQHRTGNGHVYASAFKDADAAEATLLANLDAAPIGTPKHLRFTTGRREEMWCKNVVSLGLASGFLEPLESTSIHIIQSNVSRLMELFPDRAFDAANIAEYNRIVAKEYDLIRDFLILHYKLNRREGEFWAYVREMDVPESLTHKMELFRNGGHLFHDADDLFRESSWVQVMLGQGLEPEGWHRRADRLTDAQLSDLMGSVQALVAKAVDPLPSHADFIARYAPAKAA